MPKARSAGAPDPANTEGLYARGKYRLEWDRRRDGTLRTPFLQIVWYDGAAGRNRSKSTGTADVATAEDELDKLYLQRERGQTICHACGQAVRGGSKHLVTTAIADYVLARAGKPSIDAIRARLGHINAYITAIGQEDLVCEAVDEDWIEGFREWAIEVPVPGKGGTVKPRAPSTVENSVRQLAAVINFAHERHDTTYPAAFSPKKPEEVNHTPTYRADIPTLAAMFRYALQRNVKTGEPFASRRPLLKFLRISVATWCRPDAAHDFSTDPKRAQWLSNARVVNLNPKGRAQTRKYRPAVPVPEAIAWDLEEAAGYYVGVDSVKSAFESMLDHLKLPRGGETGMKLIRRSMATIGRKLLGEEHWVQGERMLGHHKASVSDIYALPEPGQLGRALAVTTDIINQIEALAPGAFHRTDTGRVLRHLRAVEA
jgi:hypothetical protein